MSSLAGNGPAPSNKYGDTTGRLAIARRLYADDRAVSAGDLRLVVGVEAPLADRDLEIVLDRQPLLHHLGGVGREQRIAAAAAALRLEHRDVGVHQERLVVAPVRRADRDAGARADHHAGAADLVGF